LTFIINFLKDTLKLKPMFTYTSTKRRETVDLTKVGSTFFIFGMIGFGIEHFVFKQFVTGRAPAWPADTFGNEVWAYCSGLLIILAAIAIYFRIRSQTAALLIAFLICGWSLVRQIPVLYAAQIKYGGELTNLGKALTLLGGTLIIIALQKAESASGSKNDLLISIASICVAIFFIIAGIQHFIFAEFVAYLVPVWIPGKVFWTYFAGVALLLAGIGLIIKKTRSLAGTASGLMIFTWFIILHIPRAVSAGFDPNEWTAVVESFTFSGIALILGGYQNSQKV
jgi:uncharacterized membrane protein